MNARHFGEDFFPTPSNVAYKMLGKINKDASNFLEPSAGKGDIASAIKSQFGRYNSERVRIDCIESSPDLVNILIGKEFPVVGYDFLTYPGVCYYDAIVMNPPFSNGDDHLLRAWDFLYHGEIVCLLNSETITNPYTAERQRLANVIAKHGSVETLGDCFRQAERGTAVNIALVYLKKEGKDDLPFLWARGAKEKEQGEAASIEEAAIAIRDELGNMEEFYNLANVEMLAAFDHLRKAAYYMSANGVGSGHDYKKDVSIKDILPLALQSVNQARAEFSMLHRRAAWRRVFEKMQFRKWLDKKQTEEFIRDIERSSDIPFTAENIKGTLDNIFCQRGMLFEKSVANVFDELTRYFDGNTNYKEGWKSNEAHIVNFKKLVFPYGCRYSSPPFPSFSSNYHGAIDIYNDLDRILCVLDKRDFAETNTVERAMQAAWRRDSKNPGICQSEYFEIRYFKKGTVHLKWKRKDLWEQFNTKAAAGRKWIGQNRTAS